MPPQSCAAAAGRALPRDREASARRTAPDRQRRRARADRAQGTRVRRAAVQCPGRGTTSALAMPDLYPLIRPALRRLPAEAAHELTVRALEAGLGRLIVDRAARRPDPPILAQRLWGLEFPNPLGLAAGFDKDARVFEAMRGVGFGFVEIGTVTPRPQPGNPKPRLFRLEEDQAIINRMGFNSGGLDAAIDRLQRPRTGIVGVNLGKNRDSDDAVADYAE